MNLGITAQSLARYDDLDVRARSVDRHRFKFRVHDPHDAAARVEPGVNLFIDFACAISRRQNLDRHVGSAWPKGFCGGRRRQVLLGNKRKIRRSHCVGIAAEPETGFRAESAPQPFGANVASQQAVQIVDHRPMPPTARRHGAQFSQHEFVPLTHPHRHSKQFIGGNQRDRTHIQSIAGRQREETAKPAGPHCRGCVTFRNTNESTYSITLGRWAFSNRQFVMMMFSIGDSSIPSKNSGCRLFFDATF